jgi:hypothetical protein
VIADLEVHLDLPVGQLAVLRRVVLVVGRFLEDVDRAALLEIARDFGLIEHFFGFAAGDDNRECKESGEHATHDGEVLRIRL